MWGDAQRKVDQWTKAPDEREKTKAEATPITQAIAKYLVHCRVENNVAGTTYESYKNTLDHFTESLNQSKIHRIGDIGVESIRDFLAYRAETQARTRRKELEHIRFFLWFCVDNNWIAKNPAISRGQRGIKVKVPKNNTKTPFTDEEIKTLLAACDRIDNNNKTYVARARLRSRALILGMCYTGLRISDMITLKRSEVRLDGTVEDHVIYKTKNLLFTNFGALALKALMAVPPEGEYFFWSGPGKSKISTATGSARRTFDSLKRMTGINIHPHRFRDTFSLKILEETGDIRLLQELLGHSSVKTTETSYAHPGPNQRERLRKALGRINYAEVVAEHQADLSLL